MRKFKVLWQWFRRLIFRRWNFKTYGGYVGGADVQLHTREKRILSRKVKFGKVQRL